MAWGFGSSTWNHIPACCGAPAFQVVNVSASFAASAWWLALTFQPSVNRAAGSEAISSGTVHIDFRLAVPARTRATSAGTTSPPVLPKLRRTNDAIAATQSSSWVPIGIITSV